LQGGIFSCSVNHQENGYVKWALPLNKRVRVSAC